VRKYKVYRKKTKVSKAVEARKKWKKFGDAKPGEQGVTFVGEEVGIETTASKQKEREEQATKRSIDSRIGKPEPWSLRAARLGAQSWDEITGASRTSANGEEAKAPADNVFRPRSLREARPLDRGNFCCLQASTLTIFVFR
jgi:hypothetical protein